MIYTYHYFKINFITFFIVVYYNSNNNNNNNHNNNNNNNITKIRYRQCKVKNKAKIMTNKN